MSLKISIGICMIMSLMSLSALLVLAAEEQTLREELETHRSRNRGILREIPRRVGEDS